MNVIWETKHKDSNKIFFICNWVDPKLHGWWVKDSPWWYAAPGLNKGPYETFEEAYDVAHPLVDTTEDYGYNAWEEAVFAQAEAT